MVFGRGVDECTIWEEITLGCLNIEKSISTNCSQQSSTRTRLELNYVNYKINSVDIVSAFLNGDLPKDIMATFPRFRLIRHYTASNRHLGSKIDSWLRSVGFKPSQADTCLYI
jgi:hypothetical protein